MGKAFVVAHIVERFQHRDRGLQDRLGHPRFFQDSGIPFTLLVERGEVRETLDRVSDNYAIDLIILGSHAFRDVQTREMLGKLQRRH